MEIYASSIYYTFIFIDLFKILFTLLLFKKIMVKHEIVQNNSRNLIIRDVYQYNANTSLFTC